MIYNKDFLYQLRKILSEELPFSFTVIEEGSADSANRYIQMDLPEDFQGSSKYLIKFTPIIIDGGVDVETFIEYPREPMKYFGKFKRAQDAAQVLIPFLERKYAKEIELLGNMAYVFSAELQDFLKKNGYTTGAKDYHHNSPDIEYINHFGNWVEHIYIVFSEYHGSVYLEVRTDHAIPEYDADDPVYRATLSRKNQKEVFTDILKVFRKLEVNTDKDMDEISELMYQQHLRDNNLSD